MTQIIQVLGSSMILVPFMLVQFKALDPQSLKYILPNLIGSTILAVQAAQASQWGFLLLEGVWALVSVGGAVQRILFLRRSSLETTYQS